MRKVGEAITDLAKPRRSNGADLPADSDEICPVCRGAGWLRNDVPVGHHMFGRPIACECLTAKRDEQNYQELLAVSNLEAFRDQTFANFDATVPGVDSAYHAAKDFARDPDGWLVLRGNVGCGKTHLAAAIANEAIRGRTQTLFVIVPELLDHLRATFFPTSQITYDELFERVRGVTLLVMDDLGTESSTPWAQEKLFQIFNHRYIRRMPSVITTNRDLNRIEERIASRMTDCACSKVLEIKATSYRLRPIGQRRFREQKTRTRRRS